MSHKNVLSALTLGLSILALSPAALAAAGSEGGGGGNAVVCFDNPSIPLAIRDRTSPRYGQILDEEVRGSITSIETYDLYEARMPRGLEGKAQTIMGLAPGESTRGYVERVARRFEKFVPQAGRVIRDGMFPDKQILIRSAGLNRIHDEADVGYIDATRCVVATMAAQYEAGSESLLQIDGRLFHHPKHSDLSRAVLFLHESIYWMERNNTKHKDSRATRTLVGRLIDAQPTTAKEIAYVMARLGMPLSWAGDNVLSLALRDFVDDGEMKERLGQIRETAERNGIPFQVPQKGSAFSVLNPKVQALGRAFLLKVVQKDLLPKINAMTAIGDETRARAIAIILDGIRGCEFDYFGSVTFKNDAYEEIQKLVIPIP